MKKEQLKTYTKKELRELMQVSKTKFNKWVNVVYFDELQLLGYYKHDKILTAKCVGLLVDRLGINIPLS